MARRKPILNWLEYVRQHNQYDKKLQRYIRSEWGRTSDTRRIVQELKQGSAKSLFATNKEARFAFLRWARRAFRKAKLHPPAGFFMLTLSPRDFALPLSQAIQFDHEELKKWARSVLVGIDYFGMVDVALYTNLAESIQSLEPTVSWHIHVIAWGRSKAVFQQIVDDINEHYDALVAGRTAAHLRVVKDMLGRLCYVLKAPLSDYRVYPRKKDVMDPETGELTRDPIQRKRPLRPGDALKVCSVLAGRKLPSLAFAGGRGIRLLQQTLSNARLDLQEQGRRRKRKLERAYYGARGNLKSDKIATLPHPRPKATNRKTRLGR